ncbi:hypothetical protein NP493_4147g00004 [Ridgeia piscesae]|uniref:Uncharacterized protein n=1 Tax=Ridgeia piscesae TaxID=27915 RepID=A0AAD9J2B9_RIDPI|nr:hypothetical protein NP493_4147g00004 [Ridgeia piscesae]
MAVPVESDDRSMTEPGAVISRSSSATRLSDQLLKAAFGIRTPSGGAAVPRLGGCSLLFRGPPNWDVSPCGFQLFPEGIGYHAGDVCARTYTYAVMRAGGVGL